MATGDAGERTMMKSQRLWLAVVTAAVGACEGYPYLPCAFSSEQCGNETGATDGDMICLPPEADGSWVCIDTEPWDARVEKAIDEGLLIPWTTEGSCPHRGRTWEILRDLDPITTYAPPVMAVECSEDNLTEKTQFSVCVPEQTSWQSGGIVNGIRASAAVSIVGSQWAPDCTVLPPYAFAYDYLYAAPCDGGVTCLGVTEECACKCADDLDCNDMQTALELTYFGEDANGLIPGGWEATCTGYPWDWDNYAYGTGGYVGTSCEWNGVDPQPGDMPQPLQDALDAVTCTSTGCTVPESLIDGVLVSPGLLAGSSAFTFDQAAIEVDQCNHLCVSVGLAVGDRIVGIGDRAADPTDPASWVLAYDELLKGSTEVSVMDPSGNPRTITVSIES